MSSFFDWFKRASNDPGKKNTDHKPVEEQSNFSSSILNLMKQKRDVSKGYYAAKRDLPTAANDSDNNPKPKP